MGESTKPEPIPSPDYIGRAVTTFIGIVVAVIAAIEAMPKPSPKPDIVPVVVPDAVPVGPKTIHVFDSDGVLVDKPSIAALSGEKANVFTINTLQTNTKPVILRVQIGDVEPGPKPEPRPEPKPQPLTGFAGEVQTKCAGLPLSDRLRLADNYDSVASQIAAGGIKTLEDANEKITSLNSVLKLDKAVWRSFGEWIGSQFEQRVNTLQAASQLMAETAEGLRK